MKKHIKKITMFMILLIVICIGFSFNTVSARDFWAKGSAVKTSTDNWFEYTSGNTDHTYYMYTLTEGGNTWQAWCVECGIPVNTSETYYVETQDWNSQTDRLISYYMASNYDNQIKQAAIWEALGTPPSNIINGGEYEKVTQLKNEAQNYMNAGNCGNAVFGHLSTSSLSFSYDNSIGAYVSNAFEVTASGNGYTDVTISGVPTDTYFLEGSTPIYSLQVPVGQSRTVRIAIPTTNITGDLNVTVTASGGGVGVEYLPCIRYVSGESQDLAVPATQDIYGGPATASGYVNVTGGLKIQKSDEYGKPVSGAVFRITGPEEYGIKELATDSNGIIDLGEIPIGTYTAQEISVGHNLYVTSTTLPIEVQGGDNWTLNVTNKYKRGSAQLIKRDAYEDTNPKGDSILAGAEYTLYAAEPIYEGDTLLFVKDYPIARVVTDSNGETPVVKEVRSNFADKDLDGLPIGNYYWKETRPSTGFLLNGDPIYFSITNDAPYDYKKAEMDKVVKKHLETPIKGKVKVIKMDNDNNNDDSLNDTDKDPSAGAELRLALISDPSEFYDVVIDENGYAEFVDEDFKARYPGKEFTIPYGRYELTEIKASDSGEHTYYFIQPETVNVNVDGETERRILMDEPVPMHLQVVKTDEENNEEVYLTGAKFKIWDCAANNWVSLYDPVADKDIDTFETGEHGYFITPDVLYAGDYIVYETDAPYGYYLNNEWRIPENEEDIGVIGKGGKYLKIDKQALGLTEDAEYPGLDAGDLIYKVEMPNTPVTGKVTVEKKGLMLTDAKQVMNEDYGSMLQPVYTEHGLPGVTYDIYAAEEIRSADGRILRYSKDQKVGSMTTGEDGVASFDHLYLGKYYLIESDSEDNRVLLEEDKIPFEIKYEGQYVKEVNVKIDQKNDNKNAHLTFEKDFEKSGYLIQDENGKDKEIYAVFGVYTNQDIKDYKNTEVLIPKDQLLDVVKVNKGEVAEVTLDLPAGSYYYKELYVTDPYLPDPKNHDFVIEYDEENSPLLEIKGETVKNELNSADVALLKLSTVTVAPSSGNGILVDGKVDPEILTNRSLEIYEDLNGSTLEQLKEYVSSEEFTSDYKELLDAEYGIYLNSECTVPLKYDKDGVVEDVTVKTDRYGMFILEDVPVGNYWIKELKAPINHELSTEPIPVDLHNKDEFDKVFRVAFDENITWHFTKEDVFTSDAVPNCKFKITDEEGNEIVSMTTDENGDAYLAMDLFEKGKTYYYQEITAPEPYIKDGKLYELNTEPHPFVFDYTYDEENKPVFVDHPAISNYRATIDKLVVKKIDNDTGEPLQGCKFSIVLLDENGNPYVNKDGETIYLVKDAVTDENGEYTVEKPVYGSYRFIETEAPEGYDLAEQEMDGYEFTIDDNTPDVLIFEVTNTGDIAVVAIAAIAVVCVAGIVFVVVRNRKANKKA